MMEFYAVIKNVPEEFYLTTWEYVHVKTLSGKEGYKTVSLV